MIKTSRQLKDLIRNMAKGDSGKSQLLIRNYAMERFLERVALSKYKDNFILKGGMLVSAMVGLDNRATMDIDTTIRNFPLDCEHAKQIVEEIAATPIDDNIRFEMKDVSNIMDEAEYGGVRLSLDAFLDTTKIPLKEKGDAPLLHFADGLCRGQVFFLRIIQDKVGCFRITLHQIDQIVRVLIPVHQDFTDFPVCKYSQRKSTAAGNPVRRPQKRPEHQNGQEKAQKSFRKSPSPAALSPSGMHFPAPVCTFISPVTIIRPSGLTLFPHENLSSLYCSQTHRHVPVLFYKGDYRSWFRRISGKFS